MIALQNFERSDYAALISWIEDAESLMQFAGPAFTFPLTVEQLEQSHSDKNRHSFKVIDTAGEAVIGHAEIYLSQQSAYLGRIIIGDKKFRGKGLGQQLVYELLKHAFFQLNQTKAALNVFDWNTAAINCYKKVGFVFNPLKKAERVVNGKTWTVLNMVTDKEKFLETFSFQTTI
jgi:RimJ/RimL family protein N-acetyltransferase